MSVNLTVTDIKPHDPATAGQTIRTAVQQGQEVRMRLGLFGTCHVDWRGVDYASLTLHAALLAVSYELGHGL